jgi:hypothetical protein
MPKQPKEKSPHLQGLEAVFERHTRRFSPFDILGLRTSGGDSPDEGEGPELEKTKTNQEEASTHIGVDDTHPHEPQTPREMGGTPLPGVEIHTRVVEVKEELNNKTFRHVDSVAPTHIGVDDTHPHAPTKAVQPPAASAELEIHDILAATQVRAQLGRKARQVLGYLNSIRSLERPAYTVPVGYAQISAAADVHAHYLRRNVLPKLAMLGLIGIAHKSFQGTIYHLYYDTTFLHIITGAEDEPRVSVVPALPEAAVLPPHTVPSLPVSETALPPWIDREHWGWLTTEIVHQLVAKAGTEAQAQEKLEIILYNETHGPVERHVRDRRAVLAYYLRTPQADIWPNDDGFETLALRRARQNRDRALQEKTLMEEALRARQDAAKARFLTALTDAQLHWLKQEAKQRVDAQSGARFLTSRYPLYKAEEEQLIHEWMDRVDYGERVPHGTSEPQES